MCITQYNVATNTHGCSIILGFIIRKHCPDWTSKFAPKMPIHWSNFSDFCNVGAETRLPLDMGDHVDTPAYSVYSLTTTQICLLVFSSHMNFCQPVEPSVLENTNLQTTPSHSTADLLFFPGLVQLERPDCLVQQGALEFGWCLRCVDPHEFLSSRFLHVLLLSVAYKFPLASQGLNRMCRVWKNVYLVV